MSSVKRLDKNNSKQVSDVVPLFSHQQFIKIGQYNLHQIFYLNCLQIMPGGLSVALLQSPFMKVFINGNNSVMNRCLWTSPLALSSSQPPTQPLTMQWRPGVNFIELPKQKTKLFYIFLLSRNEQNTTHKLYMGHGNIFFTSLGESNKYTVLHTSVYMKKLITLI